MARLFLTALLFMHTLISAAQLGITADKFVANDAKKLVTFEGNAQIGQGDTVVNADKVTLYFDAKGDAKKYQAVGNVRFRIKAKETHYRGSCQTIIYAPKQESYLLKGNIKIKDTYASRIVTGSTIRINQKTGNFTIVGSEKKRAKLIFNIE